VIPGKRVIFVGGTGTISGPLVDALVEAGHEVTIFVRGQSRRPVPDGVRVLAGDRRDRAEFERLMRREAFDVAYDMICFDPEDAASSVRAFEGVGHFIQTSTVCTFGGPFEQLPVTEATPLRPVMDYGKQKLLADEVFLEAHRKHGFPVTIVKPAHTWGPGMHPVRQLADGDDEPHWIERLRAGKPLLIAGEGRELWSMCHAEDTAPAYAGLMLQPWAVGETYILTGEPVTWLEYHEEVAAVLEAPLNLVYAPVDDVIAAWPEATWLLAGMSRWDQWYDASKLRAALPSFRPRLTVRDRILEQVRWSEEVAPPTAIPAREDAVLRKLGLAS
jgi:nucleoside-diphosphate-sugar epimerase